jgi:hypothetical protein
METRLNESWTGRSCQKGESEDIRPAARRWPCSLFLVPKWVGPTRGNKLLAIKRLVQNLWAARTPIHKIKKATKLRIHTFNSDVVKNAWENASLPYVFVVWVTINQSQTLFLSLLPRFMCIPPVHQVITPFSFVSYVTVRDMPAV